MSTFEWNHLSTNKMEICSSTGDRVRIVDAYRTAFEISIGFEYWLTRGQILMGLEPVGQLIIFMQFVLTGVLFYAIVSWADVSIPDARSLLLKHELEQSD